MKHFCRSAVLAVLALAVALSACPTALADPIAAKQAQAASVQAQINVLNGKAETAIEAYNAAAAKTAAITHKVHTVESRIRRLQKRTHKLQVAVDNRANREYRSGTIGALELVLNARSFYDLQTVMTVLQNMNYRDSRKVAQLKAAKRQAQAARKELVVAQRQAAKQEAVLGERAREVHARLNASKHLLASINVEIRLLIAQRQAAMKAAAARRFMHYLATHQSVSRDFLGGNPPTSSAGAAAVWWAEKALGKPYVWAASGPNSFDCSGLTMWAYAHVGIKLPHHAADQINRGARVSRSNLQPGDLVFFGSPIHHVGMYIGGGAFIEAPYTGTNVRISSLSDRMGDYAGACRPGK